MKSSIYEIICKHALLVIAFHFCNSLPSCFNPFDFGVVVFGLC